MEGGYKLDAVIQTTSFVLGQGSMYERLRRSESIEPDPQIFHAGLVYVDVSDGGQAIVGNVERSGN